MKMKHTIALALGVLSGVGAVVWWRKRQNTKAAQLIAVPVASVATGPVAQLTPAVSPHVDITSMTDPSLDTAQTFNPVAAQNLIVEVERTPVRLVVRK